MSIKAILLTTFLAFGHLSDALKLRYDQQVGDTSPNHPYLSGIDKINVPIDDEFPEGERPLPEFASVPLPAVPPEQINRVRLAAFYAATAYCSRPAVVNMDCGRRCDGLPRGTSALLYYDISTTSTTGFVALEPPASPGSPETLVISFRGSVTLQNWIKNMEFKLATTPWLAKLNPNAFSHYGFMQSYLAARDILLARLPQWLNSHTGCQVLVTGHSLGGAVATFAALDLLTNPATSRFFNGGPHSLQLVTFGAPRVGNAVLANLIQDKLRGPDGNILYNRITNANDPVPHLPPYRFDFRHPAQELHSPLGMENQLVACSPLNGEDLQCADAYSYPDNVSAHLQTLGVNFGSPCEGVHKNIDIWPENPNCEIIIE